MPCRAATSRGVSHKQREVLRPAAACAVQRAKLGYRLSDIAPTAALWHGADETLCAAEVAARVEPRAERGRRRMASRRPARWAAEAARAWRESYREPTLAEQNTWAPGASSAATTLGSLWSRSMSKMSAVTETSMAPRSCHCQVAPRAGVRRVGRLGVASIRAGTTAGDRMKEHGAGEGAPPRHGQSGCAPKDL